MVDPLSTFTFQIAVCAMMRGKKYGHQEDLHREERYPRPAHLNVSFLDQGDTIFRLACRSDPVNAESVLGLWNRLK